MTLTSFPVHYIFDSVSSYGFQSALNFLVLHHLGCCTVCFGGIRGLQMTGSKVTSIFHRKTSREAEIATSLEPGFAELRGTYTR